jgi:hypothetical protein
MAAIRASADRHTADNPGLVPNPDLPELNSSFKMGYQVLYQLPKIDAVLRGKEKDNLRLIQKEMRRDELHPKAPFLDPLSSDLIRRGLFLHKGFAFCQIFVVGFTDYLADLSKVYILRVALGAEDSGHIPAVPGGDDHNFTAIQGSSLFGGAKLQLI